MVRRTPAPPSPPGSWGTCGSAAGPNSRTLCHSAGRWWVQHPSWVSGMAPLDVGSSDSSRSSAVNAIAGCRGVVCIGPPAISTNTAEDSNVYIMGNHGKFREIQIRTLPALRPRARKSRAAPPDPRADRAFLGIATDEDLAVALNRYAEQVAETRRLLRQARAT
jgi:hypothetical protein